MRSKWVGRVSGAAWVFGAAALVLGAAPWAAETALSTPDGPEQLSVPRSSTIDVPLSMVKIRPLRPMTMIAINGPRTFTTRHRATFNGHSLSYRAILAETIIENPAGTPAASVFTTSYVAEDASDPAQRPVLFIFNGGPGASSIFLHFGSLGPKRLSSLKAVDFGSGSNPLIDNPNSVLDAADLVFLDPADTGFGHSAPGAAEQFRSVDGDSESLTQVVINWLRTHHRMNSPKYLYGESYGSMRAVAMARDLARSDANVVVNGVVLGGFAITFGQNGRVPSPIFVATEIPMMASVAWHYGKIDNKNQTWQQAVDKARAFARNDYIGALMMGNDIDGDTRERIITRLSTLIGIPESYFREHHTIAVADFNAELLKEEGLIVNRNDGLQTTQIPQSSEPGDATESKKEDPPYKAFQRDMEAYAIRDLKAIGLGSYQPIISTSDTPGFWDFETAGAPALDVTLATVMREHPEMRLLILQGRYDTLTDLYSTQFVMAQTNVSASRYLISYFDGGHMLTPEPEAMSSLRDFVRKTQR